MQCSYLPSCGPLKHEHSSPREPTISPEMTPLHLAVCEYSHYTGVTCAMVLLCRWGRGLPRPGAGERGGGLPHRGGGGAGPVAAGVAAGGHLHWRAQAGREGGPGAASVLCLSLFIGFLFPPCARWPW